MGVLGLTPFLQRHCPQVIKTIPERLRDFGGKTIVFDGTLITCRFHFAGTPNEYKHVLGWYRVITELRNNNVDAICVFDGAGRSSAKVLEYEKRRSARRLVLSRWSLEVKRQERLAELHSLLKKSMVIPLEQRQTAISQLMDFIRQKRIQAQELQHMVSEQSDTEELQDGIAGQSATNESPPVVCGDHTVFADEYLESLFPNDIEKVTWTNDSVIKDQDFTYPDERPIPSNQYDISEQRVEQYALHESQQRAVDATVLPSNSREDLSEGVLESRAQLALSKNEEIVWAKIERMAADPRYLRTPALLKILMHRSKVLSDNYQRRAKPPTEQTYAESKMLLRALGVPCIDVNGQYEAEGFAATLVRRGMADFVASEDTDVLVYGAPLLRNVTTRNTAICAISPEEVRRALRLSRAAFMDFTLLIGTDFVPRLRNVGPVRALNFITAHSRIERVVRHELRYVPPDVQTYLEQVRQARRVFTTLPPVPPKKRLRSREVDKEKVTEVLSRFGLSRAAEDTYWDPAVSLAGNYFADDPTAGSTVVGVDNIELW